MLKLRVPGKRAKNALFMFLLVVVGFSWIQGCAKDKKTKEILNINLPIKVSGELSEKSIVSDNLLDISFRWELTGGVPSITKDYTVFLHFYDSGGDLLFNSDHMPSIHTTQWEIGKPVTYTRTVYIPFSVEQKKVLVVTGLYEPSNIREKIGLSGTKNVYKPGRYILSDLTILPSNDYTLDTERMEFKQGWYQIERDVPNRLQWRWTKKEAICSLKNTRKPSVFYIRGWVPKMNPPMEIEITINNHQLEKFSATKEFIKKYDIGKELLGEDEWIDLVIRTNKLYKPAEHGKQDPRSLGIMVKRIFFRENKI